MCIFPNINMIETGLNIKALREQNGYSVRDLQEAMGFATTQAIYKWQQGATLPSIDNLLALSVLFHVRIEDILVCDIPAAITHISAHPAA